MSYSRIEGLLTKIVEKVIASVELKDDKLCLRFDDGTGVALYDGGQSCCEHRYMVCDDDLAYHAGASLLSVDIADAPEPPKSEYGDEHKVQFLRVTTSKGVIVCSNYNEHNGYYGGFSIQVEELAVENDR